MTIVKFTDIESYERNVADHFPGLVWVYCVVPNYQNSGRYFIGICIVNQKGFIIAPGDVSCSDNLNEISDYADQLNLNRGFGVEAAMSVIESAFPDGERLEISVGN